MHSATSMGSDQRTTSLILPGAVESLVNSLSQVEGVQAITIGGSQAMGTADTTSDWDLGVFYQGRPDFGILSALGTLHSPGSWGRFMNGGAWLVLDGLEVDVILRDIEVVETWCSRARQGEYEVDQLLGYLAGFPSYTLMAEIALSKVIFGSIDIDVSYPENLQREASTRWAFQRDFSLDYARMHARRGDHVGTVGNLVRASFEEAHRRMCSDKKWVLNEKRLLNLAGLSEISLPTQSVENLEDEVLRFSLLFKT